jgi:hypothetical protein
MDKVCYMDEEIIKMQIAENFKLIDQLIKELKDSSDKLIPEEKAVI